MAAYFVTLAEDLLKEHPGIPNIKTSKELLEAVFLIMRKRIVKDGVLHIENLGKIIVKRMAGTDKKRDPKTGIPYKIPPRNIVKFMSCDGLKKIINIGRSKRTKVG